MLKWLVACLGVLWGVAVQAGVVIYGTRVVYPANVQASDVMLQNPGESPALVQAWLEHGENGLVGQKIPFVITPQLVRVDPNTEQSLRVLYTGESLPKDRESLFYLNVLDVPPKPKNASADDGHLQVTIRNRLKFFFRPVHLPYGVVDAYDKVIWRLDGNSLTVKNPTPYYVTYAGALIKNQGRTVFKLDEIDMLAPFGEQRFVLPKEAAGADKVNWYIINDYGVTKDGTSVLKRQ